MKHETQSQIAMQVAHDIRSPLTALNIALNSMSQIPDEQLRLLQQAIKRINEIADDLLKPDNGPESRQPVEGLAADAFEDLVNEVLEEKRLEHTLSANV